MRRRIIAVIALIPALLFGCAGPTTNTTTQTGNTSSQEVAQEDSTQNSVTLTALQRSDGWNYGGSGSDGFYYVSSSVRDDGSANLMYLDYATMEKIYLCNQPNCNHDTEACTSYLPYSAGGILPCVIGQNLVLVFPGNVHASADTSSTVMPHLEVMGLDGSNRKTTFTFESNQQINRPLVTDGTNIYCELDSSTKTQNAQLTSEAQTLQSENEALKAQVENLKSVLLNTYSMDEVDKVVAQGYLDEVETKRLDNLEMLDSERCEQVSSVKDLYGTTHSVSYKFDPWQEAWAKFKLDGKYDTFEANIVTSDDTNRDANMSIEIYVDDVLVGRVDDIVRDENVRPISVSVNGGKVLMIKAVNTNSAGNSYCYVSDTNLALLQ